MHGFALFTCYRMNGENYTDWLWVEKKNGGKTNYIVKYMEEEWRCFVTKLFLAMESITTVLVVVVVISIVEREKKSEIEK